jgi:hypothetical protein
LYQEILEKILNIRAACQKEDDRANAIVLRKALDTGIQNGHIDWASGDAGKALEALKKPQHIHPWLMEAKEAIQDLMNKDIQNAQLQCTALKKVLKIAESVAQTGHGWDKLKYKSLQPLKEGYRALKQYLESEEVCDILKGDALSDGVINALQALMEKAVAAAKDAAEKVSEAAVWKDLLAESAAVKAMSHGVNPVFQAKPRLVASDGKKEDSNEVWYDFIALTDLVPNTNRLQYMFARLMNVWQNLVVFDLKNLNALMTDIAAQKPVMSDQDPIVDDWEVRYDSGGGPKQWKIYFKGKADAIYPLSPEVPFSSYATLQEYIDAIHAINLKESINCVINNPILNLLGYISPRWMPSVGVTKVEGS